MQRLVARVTQRRAPIFAAKHFSGGLSNLNKTVRKEFGQEIDDEFLPDQE
jgi:hypothetical protein